MWQKLVRTSLNTFSLGLRENVWPGTQSTILPSWSFWPCPDLCPRVTWRTGLSPVDKKLIRAWPSPLLLSLFFGGVSCQRQPFPRLTTALICHRELKFSAFLTGQHYPNLLGTQAMPMELQQSRGRPCLLCTSESTAAPRHADTLSSH